MICDDWTEVTITESPPFRFPTLTEIAHEYLAAGIALIPLVLDGTKRPAIGSWKQFQRELPTADLVDEWWAGPLGMATICGVVSGGVEVLDFDKEADTIFPQWHRLVEDIAVRLPIVETPSGGFHVYYRSGAVCGNIKIAMADGGVLIETRGEGGYIVNPSSPAAVHQLRTAYIQVAGPILPDIPIITRTERLQLWQAARAFDRANLFAAQKRKATPTLPQPRPFGGSRPWGRFDSTADWNVILRGDGWSSSDWVHWTRPGKAGGTSATLRETTSGVRVLVVFSTNAPVPPGTYSASRYLAEVQFGGDLRACNRWIREGAR